MQEISSQVQGLLDTVGEKTSAGKYLDQLTPDSREVLDEFEAWLKTPGGDPKGVKSESTARAYKGYVAQAIVLLTEDPNTDLSTDVKSAINALHRFQQAMKEEAGTAPASTDDDFEDEV